MNLTKSIIYIRCSHVGKLVIYHLSNLESTHLATTDSLQTMCTHYSYMSAKPAVYSIIFVLLLGHQVVQDVHAAKSDLQFGSGKCLDSESRMKLISSGNTSGLFSFDFHTSESLPTNGTENDHSYQVDILYPAKKVKMIMDNCMLLNFIVSVDRSALQPDSSIIVNIKPVTLSPMFDIIHNFDKESPEPEQLRISWEQLEKSNFTYKASIYLKATYIGHATLEANAYSISSQDRSGQQGNMTLSTPKGRDKLEIVVIRNEGILDKIFMLSVIIFITISYINLGAQIDTDNVRRLIEKPAIIILGLLIGLIVMPTASWLAGHYFFHNQPMYRIGSFIYACAPAASASVLWTVMFDADKELALGLQIASTFGALFTMPILLYAMDKSIDLEGQYTIKVPYMNLARTLIVLLIALVIGQRIVGNSKRAKQISQRIYRPLTMFVLLFIVIFSSIVYWYVYKMFDWTITAMALVVTSATYIISGLLGYLIHRDFDHMITISISSTYRNSGVAFAALVVAFQPPDIFIAYVPCLTQVVTTSSIGLVLYSIKCIKNRNKA